jgi:hypothetical protein
LFRRRKKNQISKSSTAAPTIPPKVPPTIAPVLFVVADFTSLELVGDKDVVDDVLKDVVEDVVEERNEAVIEGVDDVELGAGVAVSR